MYSRVILFCFRSLADCSRSFCRALMSLWFGSTFPLSSFTAPGGQPRAWGEAPSDLLFTLALVLLLYEGWGCLQATSGWVPVPLQPEVHRRPSPCRTHMGGTKESPTLWPLGQAPDQFLTCWESPGISSSSQGQPSLASALLAHCFHSTAIGGEKAKSEASVRPWEGQQPKLEPGERRALQGTALDKSLQFTSSTSRNLIFCFIIKFYLKQKQKVPSRYREVIFFLQNPYYFGYEIYVPS